MWGCTFHCFKVSFEKHSKTPLPRALELVPDAVQHFTHLSQLNPKQPENQANSLIKIKQEKGERSRHSMIFSVTSAFYDWPTSKEICHTSKKVRFSGFQNPKIMFRRKVVWECENYQAYTALWGSCNGEIRLGIFHFQDHLKQKCHFHFLLHWVLLESPCKNFKK